MKTQEQLIQLEIVQHLNVIDPILNGCGRGTRKICVPCFPLLSPTVKTRLSTSLASLTGVECGCVRIAFKNWRRQTLTQKSWVQAPRWMLFAAVHCVTCDVITQTDARCVDYRLRQYVGWQSKVIVMFRLVDERICDISVWQWAMCDDIVISVGWGKRRARALKVLLRICSLLLAM